VRTSESMLLPVALSTTVLFVMRSFACRGRRSLQCALTYGGIMQSSRQPWEHEWTRMAQVCGTTSPLRQRGARAALALQRDVHGMEYPPVGLAAGPERRCSTNRGP